MGLYKVADNSEKRYSMDDQQIVLYIVICILIMVVLALSFIWFLNHAQKKITQGKLKEQELLMDFQKNLLLNTVKTKEKERSRIAKELHDEVSSQLGIMNLNLHVLKKKLPEDKQIMEIVDQMDVSLKNSTERARTISHTLMPPLFKKFGIHHSLRALEDEINISQQIRITIESSFLIDIKDEFKLLHIYRMVQELISNTLKYAEAKQINLLFEEDGKNLSLIYTDDGKGFDVNTHKQGLGISNIYTRISLLGGEVQMSSSSGSGFKCIMKFPNHD